MAAVGFGVLFSGLFSGYFAAATTAALLTFVLPVTIPAPELCDSGTGSRAGVSLTGAAICAVVLLWPPRRRADLQREGARALRAVAALVAF